MTKETFISMYKARVVNPPTSPFPEECNTWVCYFEDGTPKGGIVVSTTKDKAIEKAMRKLGIEPSIL